MIGGNDLVIPTSLPVGSQRTAALLYLQRLWPQGKLEVDDATDFFYYKDQASHDAWNGTTADPSEHAMVYVMPRSGYVTLVHTGLDEADVRRIFEATEQPAGTN